MPTRAEAYALTLAFRPGSADVALTANSFFPDSQALFVQAGDPLSGTLAPTATVLSGLPPEVEALRRIRASSGSHGIFVLEAVLSDLHLNGLVDTELYVLSGDAAAMTQLTNGQDDVADFDISANGRVVAVVTRNGELVVYDVATRTRTAVADGLRLPSGSGGATLAVSPDGSQVAVGVTIDVGEAQLDVIDTVTSARERLATLTATPYPAFRADGNQVYFVTNEATGNRTADGLPAYDSKLFVVDATPGDEPILVADLTVATGNPLYAGPPVLHPDGDRAVLLKGERLVGVELSTGIATPVSPAGEIVLSDPVVAETPAGPRVAYIVSEALDVLTSPYHTWGGDPLAWASLVRSTAWP